MNFWDTYRVYKDEHNLVDKFLLANDIIEYSGVIGVVNIDTNHTYDRRESRASAKAIISYDAHILKTFSVDYGLNTKALIEETVDTFNDFQEYLDKREEENSLELFSKDINESEITLESQDYNNNTKEATFIFDFIGDMQDVDTLNYNNFQIAVETLNLIEEAPCWGKLLVQGLDVLDKKQFDLAFLLFFSAFENYSSLLAEEKEQYFYKEINILKMELPSKIKLLMKYSLDVAPSSGRENHPSADIVIGKFNDLYQHRNKVAHGGYRNITEEHCEECLDLFILFFTVSQKKPSNNRDLLKELRSW